MNQPMRYPTNPESIITADDELARLRQLEAVLVHCNTHGLVPPLSTEHQANALSEYRRTVQAETNEPDDEPAQCADCGSDMTLVRPGKWQCDTCESKDFIRRKQAEAVRWAADHFASPRNGHVMMISDQEQIRKLATAIERGEVEI